MVVATDRPTNKTVYQNSYLAQQLRARRQQQQQQQQFVYVNQWNTYLADASSYFCLFHRHPSPPLSLSLPFEQSVYFGKDDRVYVFYRVTTFIRLISADSNLLLD